MGTGRHDQTKSVVVPMFELDDSGCIVPNMLFHRPVDKLHSRSIEYPFAASCIGDATVILDVGTVKSDPMWIAWLEGLAADVYAIDYDAPAAPFTRIRFSQSDVRQLPFPEGMFDKVFAVSVIEHIGLESPQVNADNLPEISSVGDLDAVRELARVLRVGGELVMTLPFGIRDELILGNEARNYTCESLRKFETVLELKRLDCYEYQSKDVARSRARQEKNQTFLDMIKGISNNFFRRHVAYHQEHADIPGIVTWRNIPPTMTTGVHRNHVECVVCGVWRKIDERSK